MTSLQHSVFKISMMQNKSSMCRNKRENNGGNEEKKWQKAGSEGWIIV